MKNKDAEQILRQAVSRQKPDVIPSVLSHLEQEKGAQIIMMENTPAKSPMKRLVSLVAAFAVVAAGITAMLLYTRYYTPASTVSLDVNPSITIQVNHQEKVLSVEPLNDDGATVLGDMNFRGSDLEVTVNALIGSMLRNGYLSETANSILISVDSKDAKRGAALQAALTEKVEALLNGDSFSGAVLSQTITEDEQLQSLADTYGITPGKAQLIQQIVSSNTAYQFEDLAALSINELNLLADNSSLEQVQSTGTASDKAYIGKEAALAKAFAHAGLEKNAVTALEIDLDYENGIMVYEIEFDAGRYEYEYDINAVTGAIADAKKEAKAETSPSAASPSGTPSADSTAGEEITAAQAKSIALNHAGVTADQILAYEAERDEDKGQPVFEIEFKTQQDGYQYKIHRLTGAIVESEKEPQKEEASKAASQALSGSFAVSPEKAKEIVLAHSQLTENEIRHFSIETDKENGVAVYEIEFKADTYEYSYAVNAATGAILQAHREAEDH